ncbi:MAG: hypothetical protein P0Y53_02555 [Candidatus Pseudobacter hemicellulosilyticus]|uniref:Uncharacterized protein n=1 Tax=Candidatus Pseudobacter hemicellulosilyticus TaxID=3121375 RepID=A0AAJ5WTA0_9BACT|nr:MAG: hypothetical protein P0Y53_02555 [Pseudobacter sp.]
MTTSLSFQTYAKQAESSFLAPFFKYRNLLKQGHFYWILIAGFFFICNNINAQSYKGLNELKGYQTNTYFSTGNEAKAKRMAQQLDSVMAFYTEQLQFTPTVTLLILSPDDWNKFTKFPFYGMPHYTSNKTLIVASENNDYWKSMVPALDKIPATYAGLIKDTYSDKNGGITMEPFFDLLAIHELGHAYHNQGGLVMQRRWMGELFPNILLHTYIAEKEPKLLKALTTFPKMVVATTDTATLKYTTLQDLETNYNEIGPNYPQNYGWYQCRWHIAAGKIYDASNIQGFKKLWFTLKTQQEILNDKELAKLLNEKVHKSVADVLLKWDETDAGNR